MADQSTTDKQRDGLAATLASSLSDLVGRRLTPDLVETIKRRLNARAAIVAQLVEHEGGE